MHSKRSRLIRETERLAGDVIDSTIISYTMEKEEFVVEFRGPNNTAFHDKVYKIRFILPPAYPIKPADGFFVGEAPDHPFYSFDKDDSERPKRTTNLANTRFGITYEKAGPGLYLVDYVELVRTSLTQAGSSSMERYMQSGPL